MTLQVPLLRREREEPPDEAPVPAPVPDAGQEAPAAPEPQVLAVIPHAFRVAGRRAKDLAEREGGWVSGLLAGKPPSVNEQCDYLHQRRWLPPGHEGGIADKAGEGYHVAIGIPGVALGNWISATCARPFRFCWTAAALLGALACLLLATRPLTGLTAAGCAAIPVSTAVVITGYVALVTGLLALRRGPGERRVAR